MLSQVGGKKQNKTNTHGKLHLSTVTSRQATSFPPWDLSSQLLISERPAAEVTEQGQGVFEALPGNTGMARTRMSVSGG